MSTQRPPAFYEGVRACEQDSLTDRSTKCPYKKGTDGWWEWTRGYTQQADLEELEDFTDPHQMTNDEVVEAYVDPPQEEPR